MGLIGPYGKGEKVLKGWQHAPHGLVRIGLGGGGAPLLPSLSLPLFPSLLLLIGKGILLGLGSPSRTPYAWRAPKGRPPPPSLLYIRGEGSTPGTHKLIF